MSSPSNLQECNICYNLKHKNEFEYLPCFHSFCRCCIGKFRVNTCPLCRRPFGVENPPRRENLVSSAPGRIEGHDYITQTYVAVDLPETQRARRRRRRRNPRRQRRVRRTDNRVDDIFHLEMDDILPENTSEEKKEKTPKKKKKRRSRRRDAYQQLRLQRNLQHR